MDPNFWIGWHFRPTEAEIIHLLWLKVTNQLDRVDNVPEKILYGKDAAPWHVFGDNDDPWQVIDENTKKHGTKIMVYVFTKVTKVSAKKTARTAGPGTWDGETKPTDIRGDCGELIGRRKMLSYALNSGSKAMKGGWIMHEYSLAGCKLDGINSNHNSDYVICRIIRDDSKCTKVKASSAVVKRVKEVDTNEVQTSSSGSNGAVLGKRSLIFEEEEANSLACKKFRSNPVECLVIKDATITNLAMGQTELRSINASEHVPPMVIEDWASTEFVTDEWLADGMAYFFSSFGNLQKAF